MRDRLIIFTLIFSLLEVISKDEIFVRAEVKDEALDAHLDTNILNKLNPANLGIERKSKPRKKPGKKPWKKPGSVLCKQNGGECKAQQNPPKNYYNIYIPCSVGNKRGKCYKPIPSPCKVVDQKEWIDLLKQPCNFKYRSTERRLEGPVCDGSPKQRIGVVGAGMAGLTLSWILQYIGHEVVLLEASDRIGGRVHTYYGDGWYGDLGAMRFPISIQKLTEYMVHTFVGSNAFTNFTNYNQGPASYFYVNGTYFSSNEYKQNNQSLLTELYDLFDVDVSNHVLQNKTHALLNPDEVLDSKIIQKHSTKINWPQNACLYPRSLETYLRRRLKKLGGPQKLVDMWSVLSVQRAYLPLSLWESLLSSPELLSSNIQFKEVKNGTSELPNAIFKILTSNENFSHKLDARVTKSIVQSANQVKLEINGDIDDETYHKVIFATTSRAASLIKFDPPLPYNKTYALNSYHYANSVKIFLYFNEAFWNKTKDEGNKIDRIRYVTTEKCSPNNTKPDQCGGTGITDLSMRSIYYPSNYLHGTALLVSYVWSDDANRLTSIPDAELVQRALDDLGQIHGFDLVFNAYSGHHYVKKWVEDDYANGGAFPWGYPYQDKYLLEALRLNTPPVYFAGEYTEKTFHFWIQAAVASACRVASEMLGYDI